MSSSNNSDTTSPGPSASAKKHSSTSSSPTSEHSDGKDVLLLSLKGQVSFAKQCLGLLQNQMKHAMDTLDILQDQVTKAQTTIDRIERKASGKTSDHKVSSSHSEHGTEEEFSPGVSRRMVVVDSTGHPLYTIDNSSSHHHASCHCSSCNNIGLGHPVFISEHNQQVISLHPGQAVYHVDGKSIESQGCAIHDPCNKTKNEHTNLSECSSLKKRKHSMSDSDDAPSPRKSSNDVNTSENEGKSSPIASQLLQVLDVLQNAGDDEPKEQAAVSRSNRVSSIPPFTGPIPHSPVHSASGFLPVSRRCRKQEMSTFKREHGMFSHSSRADRDYPELMKVPPPVLAATLEPDFLVVPGNSYFSDSPPSSEGTSLERTGPIERRPSEFREVSIVEAKERFESKTSPGGPPDVESGVSEVFSHEISKEQDSCKVVSHINRISDAESIPTSTSQSNGKSHKPNGKLSIDSHGTTTQASRITYVSSDPSEPLSPPHLTSKKSQVRLIKVSPLNSAISGNSVAELRRPSLEYTSNHGIVRISSATSMTSSMTSPKHITYETTKSSCIPKTEASSMVSSGDPQLVTTYSVAQIDNMDDRRCTSPTKRPNILSKNRAPSKNDIPQGIVVLVPTIEDAKQYIKSTGGSQVKTPVLVPQNVLNQISVNGETPKSNSETRVGSSYTGKRQFTDNNLAFSRPKRSLSESMVVD